MKVMISEFEKEDLSCACLMPGVPKILEKVKDTDAIIGLVTGNLEEIAYTKLRHFKIHEFFILGGFGHISPIRSDLVEYAIKKAEEKFGKIKKSNVFIIGDTPHDIKAAKDAGVKVIATATGSYSYKEIKEKNPDYIFKNLEDTEKVIEVIQHG
jgi:phosphoglycolate phosphatase-like HAD superfamily hydrolase